MQGGGAQGRDTVVDDGVAPPRRDSMSLLRDLYASTLDDEYRDAAERRHASFAATNGGTGDGAAADAVPRALWASRLVRRPMFIFGLGVLVIGMLLATTALQARRTAPALAAERHSLVERIEAERDRAAVLRADVAGAAADLAEVRDAALQATEEGERVRADLETLRLTSGAAPLTGAGLVVTVDNAAPSEQAIDDAAAGEGMVQDIDLQQLVNGLWEAGAEAIAVDGHRVTALSSIRTAGDALFMDLQPLSPPYEVVAIGNPQSLGPRFLDSYGAGWFQFLSSAYGIGFDVSAVDEVQVAAATGLDLDWAETFPRTDT